MNKEHLFGLVQSDNDRWKGFGLETLRNCSTNSTLLIGFIHTAHSDAEDVQQQIYDFKGLDILLGTLCQEVVMKESLLILAAECILNCTEHGEGLALSK